MSIVEYARTYSVSDMTVRRRIKTGKLQAILRNGKYYIPTSAQAVNQHTQLGFSPELETREKELYSNNYSYQDKVDQHSHFVSTPSSPPRSTLKMEAPTSFYDARKRENIVTDKKRVVPEKYWQELSGHSHVSLKAQELLSFCEKALTQYGQQKPDQSYEMLENKKAQLESELNILKGEIKLKDEKIQASQKQIEELNMLIKFLENRQTG